MDAKPTATNLRGVPDPAWYDVTNQAVLESMQLWESWGLASEFRSLFDYVVQTLGNESAPCAYSPSYYVDCLKPRLERCSVANRRLAERLSKPIAQLEWCVAYCVACRRCSPKPLATYLLDAKSLLALARSTGLEIERRYKADRKRGGSVRNSPYGRVKLRILKLLQEHAPEGGWHDVISAAREILPDVRQFIQADRGPMDPDGPGLGRRVRDWIRSMPEAASFFRSPVSSSPKSPRSARRVLDHGALPARPGGRPEFLLGSAWIGSALATGAQIEDRG